MRSTRVQSDLQIEAAYKAGRLRRKGLMGGILGALVLPLMGGCNSGSKTQPAEFEAKQLAVTVKATPAEVMGFEVSSAWTTSTAGAVLAQSTTHSEGSTSLSVRPSASNGYTPLASIPLTTPAVVSTILAVDVMLPTQQRNPYWRGAVQIFLNCPSRAIYSQFLGQVELTGKPLATWNTLQFSLNNTLASGLLRAGYTDLTITVALNVAVPTSGVYFIDNLRFIPVAADACAGKPNGLACTDRNACTQGDTCQSGVCRTGSPLVCPAPDQCHMAPTCNPTTGLCSNPTKPDGNLCDDGNACTQSDSCQAGSCVGSNPKSCIALDQCHEAGTCDPKSGVCSDPAKTDGSTCDDGNACTQSDSCQTGACVGANPKVCAALDQCHVAGVCDPGTGICSDPVKDDGSACDDGNACTQTDSCQAGGCVGGNSKACTALDQCHVPGICDPGTGACSQPIAMDGTACNDGNACTQIDACQMGACVGTSPKACTALDQCHVPGLCDPSTGICSNPASPEGSPCNDGDACTQTDACLAGGCSGSNPKVCVATDQCHLAGICDPASGACSNPASPDGSPCIDGNACTKGDTCAQGACTSGAPVVCLRKNACHQDGVCDPSTGECSDIVVSCDDQNPCTFDDCDPKACKPEECGEKNGCLHVLAYDPNTCPEPAPAPEVTINDVVIATKTGVLRAGETVPVTFTLQATAEMTDVNVNFMLFPVELASSVVEVEGVTLGKTLLAKVDKGTSTHKIHLPLPSDAPEGQYQLYAQKYSEDPRVGSTIYTIEAAPVLPSFDLSGYEADSVSLFIDPESTVDPNDPARYRLFDHTGTLELVSRSEGASQVPVRAYVYLPDNSGKVLPLQIRDFQNKSYVSTLLVNDLEADQPHTLLLDLAASESVAQQLRALVPEQTPVSTQILITVNEDGTIKEGECAGTPQDDCRHQITVPATLFLPSAEPKVQQAGMMSARGGLYPLSKAASPEPLRYQFSWSKGGGNEQFHAEIHFGAMAEWTESGITSWVEGSVPIRIAGHQIEAMRASFNVSAPVGLDATASGYIGYACDPNCEILHSFSVVGNQNLPEVEKEIYSKEYMFVVYVVPVTLKLGAKASISSTVTIGTTATTLGLATISLKPSVTAAVVGTVSGGVGVPGMSGGINAEVSLVDATLSADVSGKVGVTKSLSGTKKVTGDLNERLDLELSMLKGSIGFYVEYPTIKWCKKWRLTYICGLRLSRATKNICSWPGIELGKFNLTDKYQKLSYERCEGTKCGTNNCGTVQRCNGETMECGSCGEGATCDDNECTCNNPTCASLGWACGTGTSACTSGLNCGTCPDGQSCSSNHTCVTACRPRTCTPGVCGRINDGCGGTIDCGGCDGGGPCVANRCQCTETCASLGWTCGTGKTACTSGLKCGTCPAGKTCNINHACGLPSSCEELAQVDPSATDGEHILHFDGETNKPYQAYCHQMAISPKTYLTLVNTGDEYNFGEYGGAVKTSYTRIRFNPKIGRVDIADRTFAITTGTNDWAPSLPYGTAACCQNYDIACGRANVNLEGLPFVVATTWKLGGWYPLGTTTVGADNKIVNATGGGYCGWNGPDIPDPSTLQANSQWWSLKLTYSN